MAAKMSPLGAAILCVVATTWVDGLVSAAPSSQQDVSLDVRKVITEDSHLTIFDDVSATVRDGRVTLIGKVTHDDNRQTVANRVAAVLGVRGVQNELGVFPSSRLDDELRDCIARAIYGNAGFWPYAMLPHPSIHIIVEASHVTLRGAVRTDLDRSMAQALAMQCNALSITNDLKTDQEIGNSHDEHF